MPLDVRHTTAGSAFELFPYSPQAYSFGKDAGRFRESQAMPLGRIRGVGGWLGIRRHAGFGRLAGPSTPNEPNDFDSFDLLYYRTLSRLFDGYLTVGADTAGTPGMRHRGVEIGLKLSLPLPGTVNLLQVRAAARQSSAVNDGKPRFVLLFGVGPW